MEALPGETVLDALLREGKKLAYGCKNGSCQSCMVRSLSTPPTRAQIGLAEVYIQSNCFLACKCQADQVEHVALVGDTILKKYTAEDISREMIGKDVLRLRFRVDGLSVKPGMFVRLIAPDGTKRSYSIANNSLLPQDFFEFHIRLLPDGKMSQYLASDQEIHLKVEGPFGSCTYSGTPDQRLIFIGSGTGLAPLYAILTDALSAGHQGDCVLYFGSSSVEGLYFLDELRALEESYPQMKAILCSDIPSGQTRTGSPIDVALSAEATFGGAKIYTCGHPELVKAVKKKAFFAGASMSNIHSDSFDAQV